MNWKDAKLRRRLSRVLSTAAVVGGLLSIFPWFYYYNNLPRSPQPDVGRVYSANMHAGGAYIAGFAMCAVDGIGTQGR